MFTITYISTTANLVSAGTFRWHIAASKYWDILKFRTYETQPLHIIRQYYAWHKETILQPGKKHHTDSQNKKISIY